MILINVTLERRTATAGGKQYEFPPWTESPGQSIDDQTVVRQLLWKHGAFDNWMESVNEEARRFLRPSRPGIAADLEAQWGEVADKNQTPRPSAGWAHGAPAVTGAEVPNENWKREALMAYASKHDIPFGASWSSDRLLRAVREGPSEEDEADLARMAAEREQAAAADATAASAPDGPVRGKRAGKAKDE